MRALEHRLEVCLLREPVEERSRAIWGHTVEMVHHGHSPTAEGPKIEVMKCLGRAMETWVLRPDLASG